MENVCLIALTVLLSVLACCVIHLWQVRKTHQELRALRARIDELQDRAMRADKDRLDAAVVKVLSAVDSKARSVIQALMSSRTWEIAPEPGSPPLALERAASGLRPPARLSIARLRPLGEEADETPTGRRPADEGRFLAPSSPSFPELLNLPDDEDKTPVSQSRIEAFHPRQSPPPGRPPGKPRKE